MSLDYHHPRGPVDLGDLVLSTSLDWTVKLWKTRPASSTAVQATQPSGTTSSSYAASTAAPAETIVEPLLDIPREDVVYSARWSPHKPGVFASVDGGGTLEVWDLTVDTEIPVAKAQPSIDRTLGGLEGYVAKSLDKVVWEEKEGRRVAVGGASGVVTVFEVGGELSGEGGKEEWGRMKRVVERGGR